MFIGHFAPALVAAAHPRAPRLGTLFIAAQLVDFAFFALALAGVEKMQITPGTTVMNAMDFYYMPYTHSLAGGLLFGAIMAGIIFLSGRNVTAAFITGGVVLSHWFTDFLVHAPDLTLFGYPPKLGLGLWNYPMIEMPLELGMTAAAFAFYLIYRKGAMETQMPAQLAVPAVVLGAALFALQIYSWVAPQPAHYNPSFPISALLAYSIFVWLAYRLDRTHRS